ncbi:uncharacterized protein EV154DRAFT_504094 [Mucor mucedo]|uniref:uncharacterized protein n=1 Tax=Mucor mucedo TaxID=29922 RepID=UPI00221EF712|nr:uncharacterized protein EV154DRAFT_504094 [Mucor mucedo]KAI7892781.1 hypothetical protein EV154DRAFT_504094 [Mucor mucedo]
MKMYKDEEGKDSKGFMFLHCWKILEKSYGWLNRPGVVKMKQSERRVARIIPNESDDDEYPAVHPAEITSIGERPAQPKMVEIRPAQPTVAEERPAESRMVEERPAEPIVVDERPTEPNVIEERPTEAIVVDELPMGGNIIEESKCDEKLDLATILQEFVASNEKKIKLAEEKMRWKRDREILMTDPSTITFKRYRTYIEKKQDDIMDRMLEEDLVEEDNRRQSFYTPPVSTHDTDSIENDDGPAWRTSLNNSIGALKDELEDKKADIAKAEQKLGIMKQLL